MPFGLKLSSLARTELVYLQLVNHCAVLLFYVRWYVIHKHVDICVCLKFRLTGLHLFGHVLMCNISLIVFLYC